jgi:nucleoside-diphosphate-sugar epimerase
MANRSLIPDQPNYRLNHIYVADVVRVLVQLIESGAGKGQVFNIAQDEAVPLETFLAILADYLGM